MAQRLTVISCAVFGGRNPKSGQRTGSRHRWGGGAWGQGYCDFCGRTLDEVLEKPVKPDLTLEQAIERGVNQGDSIQAEKDFDWKAYALGKPQPEKR